MLILVCVVLHYDVCMCVSWFHVSSSICRRAVPCFVVCCMCHRTINYRNLLHDMRDFAPLFLDNLCIFCACFCTVMACTVAALYGNVILTCIRIIIVSAISPQTCTKKQRKKAISKRQSPHFHEMLISLENIAFSHWFLHSYPLYHPWSTHLSPWAQKYRQNNLHINLF